MNGNYFFDTSILVYAFDESEPEKREVCKKLVEYVFENKKVGFVSNQVLAELFNALTRNVAKPLSKNQAMDIVTAFIDSRSWEKFDYGPQTVKKAMLASELFNAHFWDALIAETVKEHGTLSILTENEKDFKKIPGVRMVNPFKLEPE